MKNGIYVVERIEKLSQYLVAVGCDGFNQLVEKLQKRAYKDDCDFSWKAK